MRVEHENDGAGPTPRRSVKSGEEGLAACLQQPERCGAGSQAAGKGLPGLSALRKVPRVQLTGLLPKGKTFKSCAIVGNAGHLNAQEYGQYIDNHEAVVRFNILPVGGFEKHIGEGGEGRVRDGTRRDATRRDVTQRDAREREKELASLSHQASLLSFQRRLSTAVFPRRLALPYPQRPVVQSVFVFTVNNTRIERINTVPTRVMTRVMLRIKPFHAPYAREPRRRFACSTIGARWRCVAAGTFRRVAPDDPT